MVLKTLYNSLSWSNKRRINILAGHYYKTKEWFTGLINKKQVIADESE